MLLSATSSLATPGPNNTSIFGDALEPITRALAPVFAVIIPTLFFITLMFFIMFVLAMPFKSSRSKAEKLEKNRKKQASQTQAEKLAKMREERDRRIRKAAAAALTSKPPKPTSPAPLKAKLEAEPAIPPNPSELPPNKSTVVAIQFGQHTLRIVKDTRFWRVATKRQADDPQDYASAPEDPQDRRVA